MSQVPNMRGVQPKTGKPHKNSGRTKSPRTKGSYDHLGLVCSVDGCEKQHIARGFCWSHYMRLWRKGEFILEVETDREYILNRIKVDEEGCWIWQLSKKLGYGQATVGCISTPAHRASWMAFVGMIPAELQINHKCHKRDCVNPECLYVGTQQQNVDDMYRAKREKVLRGTDNGMSKLDDQRALAIFNSPYTPKHIHQIYSISLSLVYAIKKKLVWKHIHAQ